MDGNMRMDDLAEHLLFHKAMSENTETYQRIGGYMDILSKAESGEKLQDPVDEAIRSVFTLVLDNGIDPWEVNLSEFVRLYNNKIASDSFDMIVAGKLMFMAWRILRMQSESARVSSEPPMEVFEEPDDSFFFEEEDSMVVPELTLSQAFQRDSMRPVTVYELIGAFEEARTEMEIQKEREIARQKLKSKEADPKFDNKAHEEDDQKDIVQVWERIQRLGPGQICIMDLYTADIKENLKTFVAVLHLVRLGYLDVWQDSLPYGDIFVEIKPEGIVGSIEDSISGRVEAVM